jgi:group I intron endonuclease
MSYIVYKHTNNITGKSYVGLTKYTIEHRWSQHVYEAMKGRRNYKFYNAITKYGTDVWTSDTLVYDIETFEEAAIHEKYMIALYDCIDNGYNISEGGEGCTIKAGPSHPLYGVKKSKEHVDKSVKGTKEAKDKWTEERRMQYSATCVEVLRKRWETIEYSFYHEDYGVVTGFVSDIANKYQLYSGYLRYVTKGKSKHCNGWFLYTGDNGDYTKDPIYTFTHELYGNETLTLKDMSIKYNLSKGNLCMVAKGQRNHTGGWRLAMMDAKAFDAMNMPKKEGVKK